MSVKSWLLGCLHRPRGARGEAREPTGEPAAHTVPGGGPAHAESVLFDAEHLGVYGALIAAVRDELEHFVASHVRLHLAIAENDRFLLTSIGMRCPDAPQARELLKQFMREFKPEQVRRFLARDVIGALPNAAAIDLSQFAGLFDADARDAAGAAEPSGEYDDLLAALRGPAEPSAPQPYQATLFGRWTELDPQRSTGLPPGLSQRPPSGLPAGLPPAASQARSAGVSAGLSAGLSPDSARGLPPAAALVTPLSGMRCEFDVEDGAGRRRVALHGVVRGRRYLIGTGEGCDIRVQGHYTSRRHAEIWIDRGAWWAGDAGSTNGIRVEAVASIEDGARRAGSAPAATSASDGAAAPPVLELTEGARLVLSARADGTPGDYPWLALRPGAAASARATPTAVPTVPAVHAVAAASAGTAGTVASAASAASAGPTGTTGPAASAASAASAVPAAPRTPLTAVRRIAPATVPTHRLTAHLASGVRTLELHAHTLPVTVGRSRHQTLVVDRRHEGVSGRHLEIVGLDRDAAQVLVLGDNGVLIDGTAHPSGSRVAWPVGATLWLGALAPDEPACRLTLERIAQAGR